MAKPKRIRVNIEGRELEFEFTDGQVEIAKAQRKLDRWLAKRPDVFVLPGEIVILPSAS